MRLEHRPHRRNQSVVIKVVPACRAGTALLTKAHYWLTTIMANQRHSVFAYDVALLRQKLRKNFFTLIDKRRWRILRQHSSRSASGNYFNEYLTINTYQCITKPPSTLRHWPVMPEARWLARKTMALAMSSVVCQRRSGTTLRIFSSDHSS